MILYAFNLKDELIINFSLKIHPVANSFHCFFSSLFIAMHRNYFLAL
jgi:hypothetical protein